MYATGRRFGLGDTALDPSLLFVVDGGDVGATSPDPVTVVSSPGSGGGLSPAPCQGLPYTDPCWFTGSPNVTTTPGAPGVLPPRPMYGPEAIGPTSVPQTLPPIVATGSIWPKLLLLGVAIFATDTLLHKKGRR